MISFSGSWGKSRVCSTTNCRKRRIRPLLANAVLLSSLPSWARTVSGDCCGTVLTFYCNFNTLALLPSPLTGPRRPWLPVESDDHRRDWPQTAIWKVSRGLSGGRPPGSSAVPATSARKRGKAPDTGGKTSSSNHPTGPGCRGAIREPLLILNELYWALNLPRRIPGRATSGSHRDSMSRQECRAGSPRSCVTSSFHRSV